MANNESKRRYNVEYEGKLIFRNLNMTEIPYKIVNNCIETNSEGISFEDFRDKFKYIKKIISGKGPTQFLLEEENIKDDTSNSRRKNYVNSFRPLLEYRYSNQIIKFGVYTQWKNDNSQSNFTRFISEISKLGYNIIECDSESNINNLKGELSMDNEACGIIISNLVKKIIYNQNIRTSDLEINEYDLNTNWFDMALLKNLPESCVGTKNGMSSNQSSIILTGNEFELFPVIRRSEFSEKAIGRHITIELPVKIMSNNLKYLKEEDCNSENTVIETYITTNEATQNRVEFGTKTVDGSEYKEFYNNLYKGCKLLVVKIKGKLEYIIFALREEDNEEYLGDLNLSKALTYFDFQTRINKPEQVTFIKSDNMKIKELREGENIIYYGSPGTGKSYTVDEKSKEFDYVERVTFYPEYTHDDFIGCFMPVMSYEKEIPEKNYMFADGTPSNVIGKPVPYYTFVDGPFTKALVHALKNPNENVLLIIEELNRANAAAVFGEIFQLLDRKYEGKANDGESRYEISISNEFSEFLSSQEVPNYKKGDKIKIPCNLNIYATMNSADQGVNPLDSAFKRRWNFVYVPIDFNDVEHKDYEIDYAGGKVTWETFATTINKQLKGKDINEDKHLGEYFINKNEISDKYKFASKILLYLFDDVLKFNRRGFFKAEYKTFSDLLNGFSDGKEIFDFKFEMKYINKKEELEIDNVNKNDETNPMVYGEQNEYNDSFRVAEESENEI